MLTSKEKKSSSFWRKVGSHPIVMGIAMGGVAAVGYLSFNGYSVQQAGPEVIHLAQHAEDNWEEPATVSQSGSQDYQSYDNAYVDPLDDDDEIQD